MWSLIMEPGKKYICTVDFTFNLSMAILDLQTVKKKKDIHTVYIETEDTPSTILCHLSESLNLVQVKLDVVFPPGTTLKLYTSGSAKVHMTGFLHYDEEEKLYPISDSKIIDDELQELQEELQDELQEELQGKLQDKLQETATETPEINNDCKRKAEDNIPKNTKSTKLHENNQFVEDKIIGQFRLNQLDDLPDDTPEVIILDSDNDVEDETLLTEEGNAQTIPDKQFNGNEQKQRKNNQTTTINKEKTPSAQNTPNVKQPLSNSSVEQSTEDKNEPSTSFAGLKTFTRKVKQNQQLIKLSNGVKIQEIEIGDGPIIKPGDQVKIYYVSRVKSTGKVFDLLQDGPGLSFVYKRGEVIDAWHIGIAGMQVGGKRRIICPLKMGYGPRGLHWKNLLEFEVELLHIGNKQNKSRDQKTAPKIPNSNQILSYGSTESSSKKKNEHITALTGLRTSNHKFEQNQQLVELNGGVKIQELQIGDGDIVKPGDKVKMYYISRVKSTGQVYDLMQDGPGLSFAFQRGEVIKGWDVGIAGMKVGGKRRIICPPKMVQCSKGMKPTIKRGTLDFEVELLCVD